MPLVSVIVPVYNTEKYLRKCLDSLINQTLRDIEIILIDDGSTDGSCKIIEEFEQKYPEKVKCYHQKNRGISISRNKGLQLSKSETVAFVDSDDSVDERFCELLYNKLVKVWIWWYVIIVKFLKGIRKARERSLTNFKIVQYMRCRN